MAHSRYLGARLDTPEERAVDVNEVDWIRVPYKGRRKDTSRAATSTLPTTMTLHTKRLAFRNNYVAASYAYINRHSPASRKHGLGETLMLGRCLTETYIWLDSLSAPRGRSSGVVSMQQYIQ